MAITLTLRKEEGQLVVTFDDQAVKTALDKLPVIDRLQADPFTNGQVLTAALGGDEMLKRLANDPDNLILLDCDDTADAFAWEFATLPNERQFLCVKAGMLRVINKTSEVLKTSEISPSPLNFIALAADPLVDEGGNPREGYRLDLDNEMRSIRETLQNSGKNLTARRIPPTREHLNRALRQGPAVLHLTCHGNVVDTPTGKLAVLALENKDGSIDPLTGADLLNMSPRGVLRMVLLSSCMTATGSQANLARALALNGVPFAIGMQASFPDPLSDDLAVALYDSLFSGLSIGEALRQVRMGLARHVTQKGYVVGLPVGYVSANGWSEAFPIQQGTPSVGGLGKPGESALGGEIQPPRPLLGRNLELHQIAKHFSDGRKVITVTGTGGMGKTALAAAFAERFAWIWTRGVSGYSFANEVNAANFRYALMRVLFGDDGAQKGASLSENEQREAILKVAREWNGLWLFDNYESIIQGNQEKQPEAESIHRLIADLANGDADMLLTSREQPAGLRNERLFPDGNHALHGLGDEAGVELFFQHSVKAKEDARAHVDFALAVQRAAGGHPLAIALLAGEYDVSAVPMQAFLGNWQNELANARRGGLAGHHVTFTIAFERSYAHLSEDLQEKLASLSIFPFPFFAEGAALVWGMGESDQLSEDSELLSAVKQTLNEFTRRSLLEVDGTFREDDTSATYRFQPALRQEAARRLDSTLTAKQQTGYAAYSYWFVNLAFVEIRKQPSIVRLVLVSFGELIKNANHQPDDKAASYCWKMGTILHNLGFTHETHEILSKGSSIAQAQDDNMWRERILFQQARLYVLHGEMDRALEYYNECAQLTKAENDVGEYSVVIHEIAKIYAARGNLDHALTLYQESMQLAEQLGDKKGKAAVLSNMAYIYKTRGNLDHALSLYEESLQLTKQFGDKKYEAAVLTNTAYIYMTRGNLDHALSLYEESLQLNEQLGNKQDKAATLHQMAEVFLNRGDLDRALSLYEESLQLNEQLGNKYGKATSLSAIAIIYQKRGDFDLAIVFHQKGIHILEQLGDIGTMASAISSMSIVYAEKRELDKSQELLEQAISLHRQVGDLSGIAYDTIKIGQLSQLRGDKETAISRYHEGLVIFERMCLPQAQEVRQMIASLESGDIENDYLLTQAVAQASNAVEHGDIQSAIRYQEQAVQLARKVTDIDVLVIQISNLAQFYAMNKRFNDSILLLEESLKLGEASNYPELNKIHQLYETILHMASMSPEQQAAGRDQGRRAQIENAANQVRDAGLAYVRKQAPKRDVLQMLEGTSKQIKDGESAGSPWLDVAALCDALVALIKEESIPPVPAVYASHFSAVRVSLQKDPKGFLRQPAPCLAGLSC